MKIPILILFLFFACSSPIEDPDPPTQPVWVNKSSPDAIIEYGIDSDHSFGERIVLMWHQNFDKDLSSYNIFRGELFTNSNNISSIIYEKITTIDPTQNFGLDTLYYDENINKYTTYYYYLIVEDLANNKSVPSDTISYKLIRSPTAIAPSNTITNTKPTFTWIDNAAMFEYSNEYIIRLETSGLSNEPTWICRFSNSWFGFENEIPINFPYFPANGYWPENGESEPGIPDDAPSNVISCYGYTSELATGSYRWKVKAISEVNNETGIDEASSESEWIYFTIE